MKKHQVNNNKDLPVAEDEQIKDEYKEKYLRALADYQNLEKRTSETLNQVKLHAEEHVLKEILNIFDTLERARAHIKDEGLDLIAKQFDDFLKLHNVSKIKVINEQFNPEYMDCVEICEGAENLVIAEIAPGYLFKDKILRVAKVKVGKKGNNPE